MKKFLLFAAAGLMLASCSEDENLVSQNNGGDRDGVLSFSTYVPGSTRAAIVDKSDLVEYGFMTNATHNDTMIFTNELTQIGLGYGAAGKGHVNADIFDTKNTYYWPSPFLTDVAFYAHNIIDGAEFVDANSKTPDPANANKVKFTQALNVGDQKDLIVAKGLATKNDGVPTHATYGKGVQSLNFVHAFSKINITVKPATTEGVTFYVRQIDVIAKDGTDAVCEIKKITSNNNSVLDWSGLIPISVKKGLIDETGSLKSGAAKYSYLDADASNETANGIGTNKDYGFNLMLYPSVDDNTDIFAVRVYYMIKDNDNGTIVGNCGYYKTDKSGIHEGEDNYTESEGVYGYKTVIIDNRDASLNCPWESGKSYRYTLTLPVSTFKGDTSDDNRPDDENDEDGDNHDSEFTTLAPIRFAVTVSNWDAEGEDVKVTIN